MDNYAPDAAVFQNELLQDEHVLWTGKADAASATFRHIPAILFGILFVIITLCFMQSNPGFGSAGGFGPPFSRQMGGNVTSSNGPLNEVDLSEQHNQSTGNTFPGKTGPGAGFELAFILIPLIMLGGGIFFVAGSIGRAARVGGTIYAITGSRVIALYDGMSRSVRSYQPAEITALTFKEGGDGAGDISFGTEFYTTTSGGTPNMGAMTRTHTRPVVTMVGVPNIQIAKQLLLQLQQGA